MDLVVNHYSGIITVPATRVVYLSYMVDVVEMPTILKLVKNVRLDVGGGNPYYSTEDPYIALRNKVCSQLKEKGPCSGNLHRYYFSPTYRRCLKFIYSGCGGNNNNFKTLSECERYCGESVIRFDNSGNLFVT
ncbi:kunitz-type serine protease inhibitor kunitoxin-Phi1-like [Limulus polyphemus]|uniref:Kunitz-type serine protease inhibitor kunitoxin-Phi1-like n=1 Tax=Limulus polyphemus TaxID=6850 RepID=A0ABM1TKI4_LIMPO|nr:kunitz-type serine protease inhibitor kunitoxin-Phi1-like [Limulus polyphemus]